MKIVKNKKISQNCVETEPSAQSLLQKQNFGGSAQKLLKSKYPTLLLISWLLVYISSVIVEKHSEKSNVPSSTRIKLKMFLLSNFSLFLVKCLRDLRFILWIYILCKAKYSLSVSLVSTNQQKFWLLSTARYNDPIPRYVKDIWQSLSRMFNIYTEIW